MEVFQMKTNRFWKGEVGITGLVEDQARSYSVRLYVRGGQVRDYSCTCEEGNSHRGMCSHGKYLFDLWQQEQRQEELPMVYTSPEVMSMIREYTNSQTAQILASGEESVELVPSLILENHSLKLEFKVGKKRLYQIRSLQAFAAAVREGTYEEYGKGLGFYHHKMAFSPGSRRFLLLIQELTELMECRREAVLGVYHRDRFFDLIMGESLEVQLPGGLRTLLPLREENPKLVLKLSRYGRDGIQTVFQGLELSDGKRSRMFGAFPGESFWYLIHEEGISRCSPEFGQAAGTFLKLVDRERDGRILIGGKDIPLFYTRVLKTLAPWARMETEQIDLKQYEPEPLQAIFRFDCRENGDLTMEPCLSYGEYSFHPVEDETLPRHICRDVPREFQISHLIHQYFKYRDPDGVHLIIPKDEEAIYRLLTEGLEQFHELGEVLLSENLAGWKVRPPVKVRTELSYNQGWLELKTDTEGISPEELAQVFGAYTQKKKYYRLRSGEFLQLEAGGLYTLIRLAEEMGVSPRELAGGKLRLPAYRTLYLDSVLKEGPGVTYYRDRMIKAAVRDLKSVEDNAYPIPESFRQVLREYQKTGFQWLRTLDIYGFGGILADDMGLGKTVQAIALLADEAEKEAEKRPSLIVCPASLIYNWEHEINRFAPGLKTLVIAGSGPVREELIREGAAQPEKFSVWITSYDLLKRDVSFYENVAFRFQIIDEAQYIKNPQTQSARAVKSIQSQTRFALTGTPVENRLSELWSIFDFLMPGFLFGLQRFRREYEQPIVKDRNQEALERLRKLTAPFILRRLKRDVLKELPEKLETVVYSRLEEEQKKLYLAHALELKKLLETENEQTMGEDRFQILAQIMRLRQICCDPRLCFDRYKGPSAKLDTCMDLIRRGIEGEHQILLFSQFTSMLELIEERLKKEKIPYRKLTGAVHKEDRLRLAEEFAREKIPVFLISLKAGGTGLNLTAADVVIHYDPWWNLSVQNQATDRSHRIGQEKQVSVYRLIARDTIEENILKLQESKNLLSEQIITEGGGSFEGLSSSEILSML